MLGASIAPHDTTAPGSILSNSGGNGERPEFAQSVLTPGQLTSNLDVIGTNAALAGVTLILIILSAELFNKTVEENHDTIRRWLKPVFGPIESLFTSVGDNWNSAAGASRLGKIGPPLAVLAVAGLVYGVLEPGFGFNDKSLVMFLSVIITVGIVTYFYNGGQLIVSKRLFSADGAIKLFPIGVLVAAVCVLLTRLDGFQPGIIYGFIASAALLGDTEPEKEHQGKMIFYPALALLGLCLLAWFLISPFRDLATDHNNWWSALPEAIAVGVFVGGAGGHVLPDDPDPLHGRAQGLELEQSSPGCSLAGSADVHVLGHPPAQPELTRRHPSRTGHPPSRLSPWPSAASSVLASMVSSACAAPRKRPRLSRPELPLAARRAIYCPQHADRRQLLLLARALPRPR